MKPEVSVLNSVAASGLRKTKQLVENLKVDRVDLYAFMQDDVSLLWDESKIPSGLPKNALHAMAAAAENLEDLAQVADRIEGCLGEAKIAAFATYLPEITSPEKNSIAWIAAQKALKFLVRLAAILNSRHHPVNTIEVVGGSTVDGLWRGQVRGTAESYVVNRLVRDASVDRLMRRLREVAHLAANQSRPIRIALELEPGPLFNVGNRESLLEFCRRIESEDESFKKVVGLNLDIPHWCFLSGIEHDWVLHHPLIYNRILHAHICDHSKGHFSDAVPLSFHGETKFIPWLQLLSKLANDAIERKAQTPMYYSGFLTCELECCEDDVTASSAIQKLRDLIGRHCY